MSKWSWTTHEERKNKALSRAQIAGRVLDDDVFKDIVKAIDKKDENLFIITCRKKNIEDDMIKDMWNAARGSTDAPATQKPCW